MGITKTAVTSGVLIVAGVVAFQGCGSESIEVDRNLDAGGSDSGGSGMGTPGGAGDTSGNGPGGMGGGSSGTDGGGRGGTGARGGSSGSGPAGTGGDAGAPPFAFDPACDCGLSPDGEFYCRMSTTDAAARLLPAPASCDNDLDYVNRAGCVGTLVYRWSEGSENTYEVDVQNGEVTYMSAFGYVGALCGIPSDPNYDLGSIEAGSRANADCAPECSVCSSGDASDVNANLPACEPCSDDGASGRNTESLDDFCAFHHCPASLADAKSELAADCPESDPTAFVTTGCGTIGVIWDISVGRQAYYFDARTEALVGAEDEEDVPYGTCQAFDYFGGTVPSHCSDESTCHLCASPEGSAGAGGGGDAAGGMGGGSGLPTCTE